VFSKRLICFTLTLIADSIILYLLKVFVFLLYLPRRLYIKLI
jgi:hypothetical protein